MSNTTSTASPQASETPTPSPTSNTAPSSSANPTTPTAATTPPETTSSVTPPTTLKTTTSSTPQTTPPTSSVAPTTSNSPTPTSTTPQTSTTEPPSVITRTTQIVTTGAEGGTSTVIQTITASLTSTGSPDSGATASTSLSPSGSGSAISPGDSSSGGGLNNSGKIAVAVVVPIAAVALLVLAGIYLWRKRKARKDAEEQRRKEVEDYGYNPNADPTIPAVAAAGTYEMKEDGTAGYRGWGSTTLGGSTAGKASTTMSGGAAGAAYSDAPSPTPGGVSDTRSGEPLMHDGSVSPEGEILGAMGPAAANNRGGDVHRGPSNASSSYSGVARSDGSGEGPIGAAYGGSPQYYDQYGNGNPYADGSYNSRQGAPAEMPGAPVIRDVTARRNTRIENPAHYPQQSAGISQNF